MSTEAACMRASQAAKSQEGPSFLGELTRCFANRQASGDVDCSPSCCDCSKPWGATLCVGIHSSALSLSLGRSAFGLRGRVCLRAVGSPFRCIAIAAASSVPHQPSHPPPPVCQAARQPAHDSHRLFPVSPLPAMRRQRAPPSALPASHKLCEQWYCRVKRQTSLPPPSSFPLLHTIPLFRCSGRCPHSRFCSPPHGFTGYHPIYTRHSQEAPHPLRRLYPA
jgi:hypothetical protein